TIAMTWQTSIWTSVTNFGNRVGNQALFSATESKAFLPILRRSVVSIIRENISRYLGSILVNRHLSELRYFTRPALPEEVKISQPDTRNAFSCPLQRQQLLKAMSGISASGWRNLAERIS